MRGFTQFSLSGKVTNVSKEAIEFVSVSAYRDSSLVNTVFTDSLGNFAFIGLEKAMYKLHFSYVEYEKVDTLFLVDKSLKVQVILKNYRNNLEEVIIKQRKLLIERKADRLIFNVENSLTAVGNDALETLIKTPGVSLRNGHISLIGKSKISVMIDGKLLPLSSDDLTSYIKSIASDDILRIEVITNPPAKYDAQGNSGLINIVLKKKNKQGFSNAIRASFAQATYGTWSLSDTYNYYKNKLTFFASFNISKGSIFQTGNIDIFYPTQTWNQIQNTRDFSNRNSKRIGIDYKFSDKTFCGISYSDNYSKPSYEKISKTPISNLLEKIDSTLLTKADFAESKKYQTLNLYFKHSFNDTGKQLTFNTDVLRFIDNNNLEFSNQNYTTQWSATPNSFQRNKSNGLQKIHSFSFKADYESSIKNATLSVGTKVSFLKNGSSLMFYNWLGNTFFNDSLRSNDFHYLENNQAIYASINQKVGVFELQFGLRGESTQLKGYSPSLNQTNTYQYFSLFPTVSISDNLNDKHVIAFNYGRRINRPDYSLLNPFREYLSPFLFLEGNPRLKPSFNHNLEIAHTYNNFLTTTLAFSTEVNKFDVILFLDKLTSIQQMTYLNYLSGQNILLSINANLNQIKWLESNNQISLAYIKSKSKLSQTPHQVNGFSPYFSSVNQIILNKKKTFIAGLNLEYQLPYVDGLYHSNGYFNLSPSLKILLHNKNLQISISGNDIFRTNMPHYTTEVNQIKHRSLYYADEQNFKISFRYLIGNNKIKGSNRETSNADETKRLSL